MTDVSVHILSCHVANGRCPFSFQAAKHTLHLRIPSVPTAAHALAHALALEPLAKPTTVILRALIRVKKQPFFCGLSRSLPGPARSILSRLVVLVELERCGDRRLRNRRWLFPILVPQLACPDTAIGMLATLFALNVLTVRLFVELEFLFAIIKIVAVVTLVAVSLLLITNSFVSPSGVTASMSHLVDKRPHTLTGFDWFFCRFSDGDVSTTNHFYDQASAM